MNSLIPRDGSYPSVTGGYSTEFSDGVHRFRAKFSNGIRGIGVRDSVTVSNGKVTSNLLGESIELVALVEVK